MKKLNKFYIRRTTLEREQKREALGKKKLLMICLPTSKLLFIHIQWWTK